MSYLKPSIDFPNPRHTLAEGIIVVGGELSVANLHAAYRKGIFPWPQEGYPMLWFSPEERGVMDFDDFHLPRSLEKFLRKNPQIEFSLNQDFFGVIRSCQKQKRPGQDGTWINEQIVNAYNNFHKAGYAHSLEVWEGEALIGGIYGVLVEGVFSAESMFYKKPNASKLALWALVDHLKDQGHHWMDVQMITPVVEAMGGKYISRDDFLTRLNQRHAELGLPSTL